MAGNNNGFNFGTYVFFEEPIRHKNKYSEKIEIQELNSSEDEDMFDIVKFTKVWNSNEENYSRNVMEKDFKEIIKYEERHKLNHESKCKTNNMEEDYNYSLDFENDYGNCARIFDPSFFTILDKRYKIDSDSSTEYKYPDTKAVNSTNDDSDILSNDESNDKNTTYNSHQGEKKTEDFHSFVNKRHLSDKDFELANIGKSSSNSPTIEDNDYYIQSVPDKKTSFSRVSTPTPAAFMPRLNLCLTLPTVAEQAEPKRLQENKNKYSDRSGFTKNVNGWIETSSQTNIKQQKIDKTTQITDWMFISPRQRRRRSKHTNTDPMQLIVKEVNTFAEPESLIPNVQYLNSNRSEKTYRDKDAYKFSNISKNRSSLSDNSISVDEIKDKVSIKKHILPSMCNKMENSRHEATFLVDNKYSCKSTPTSKKVYENFYSNSLDSKNFLFEANQVGDKLLTKHLPLLKPKHWNEYLSAVETDVSVSSLHLSIHSNFIQEKKSWLKRFRDCICCK